MNGKILLLLSSFLFTAIDAYLTNAQIFEDKNIVILGGTGYLGRAIAQEIIKYNPRQLIIYSRDEVKHFHMTKLLENHSNVQWVIGDIRDYSSLMRVTKNIDIVFHVAALKRMDALESNVEEAIKTNLLGTLNVFNACVANKVDKVLFISTDKACSPINTYGACKFVSEKIFTNYDRKKISTKFMVTRFGNIIESTGSVIPIFTEKIKKGDDIPLTHEDMTRFIVSKEEAVELIFNALRCGIGGEIFVKRLPALKVVDLIEVLKQKYNAHNRVKIIGLRPGEKIHEVLINDSEMGRTYCFDDYYVIIPTFPGWLSQNESEQPIYLRNGKKIAHLYQHYNSAEAVITCAELADKFKELGLL